MNIAASLAGYRTALVGIVWIVSHLISTNELRKHSSPPNILSTRPVAA